MGVVSVPGVDDRTRCAWGDSAPEYVAYHDEERQLTRLFDVGERAGVGRYPEQASRRLWADRPIGVLDLEG